jgi:hypothetical protein
MRPMTPLPHSHSGSHGSSLQNSRGTTPFLRTLVACSLAAAAVTAAACGASSASPATVPPTALSSNGARTSPAANQLRAAAHAMAQAPNFTLAGTIVTAGTTTSLAGQFQLPDVVSLSVTPSTGTPVDVLFVGRKSFVKASDGTWTNRLTGGSGSADPRVAFSVFDRATEVAATADGGGLTTYRFTLPASAAAKIVQGVQAGSTGVLSGVAVVASGHITDLTIRSVTVNSGFSAEVRYSAVGTSPAIALPPGV